MNRALVVLSLLVTVAACGGDDDYTPPVKDGDDLDMTAADFTCPNEWPQVDRFFITNLLGQLDAAVAIAERGEGELPVGTVVQLIPSEAMVKRRAGFSPESNDWEYFKLSANGAETVIDERGTTAIENAVGKCNTCHAGAGVEHDFICRSGRGCEDFPPPAHFATAMLATTDSRCPSR